MLIFPAIDLLGGKCVRMTEGAFGTEKVYSEDPVATAKAFCDEGATWIHVVDLDGAKSGRPLQHALIEEIVKAVTCKVQVGGGLRRLDDVQDALDTGAERAVVGSALATDNRVAAAFVERFQERLVAGIDTRRGNVATQGWTQTSTLRGPELAKMLFDYGCRTVVHTDVGRDGTMTGPNLESLKAYVEIEGLSVVASGGVTSLEDLGDLAKMGVDGAIVGRALYEGRLNLRAALEAYPQN